jgi:hypothetical protein
MQVDWRHAPLHTAAADSDDENGRGMQLVNALTRGRWGWQAVSSQAKVVWAELTAELPSLMQCKVAIASRTAATGPSHGARDPPIWHASRHLASMVRDAQIRGICLPACSVRQGDSAPAHADVRAARSGRASRPGEAAELR